MDTPVCAAARSAHGRRSGGDLLSQHSTGRDAMAKDKEVSREERLERLAHQELRHDTIGNLNAGYAGFQLRRRVKKNSVPPVGNKFSLLVPAVGAGIGESWHVTVFAGAKTKTRPPPGGQGLTKAERDCRPRFPYRQSPWGCH